MARTFGKTSADVRNRVRDRHAEPGADPIAPWLLRQKILIPDPVDGFVERFPLASRCDLTRWRVTAINAPGGFGKTTLLAEACRALRERDIAVAWLTVDDDDGPDTLAAYLSVALADAGVALRDSSVTTQDLESSDYRINLLLRSIELLDAPCVLAVDDVHRLSADSMTVVNRLLQHAPPNLHLALAFRGPARGLDWATPILQGNGVSITAEELRFEKPDIARFFESQLTRAELTELADTSHGWPIALCIQRNIRVHQASDELAQEIALNWIETRLWRGLSRDDQEFVLDIGLFEWIDPELVDAALGVGSARRIRSMAALSGLVRSVGDKDDTLALHPLIRQYCAAKRFREDPDRYRSIHGVIADTLARHGHVIAAMRHATEAGNPRQVGEILIGEGGFRLWLRHGLARLRQANELLTDSVLAEFPRLVLVRCMELTMRGELEESMSSYLDLGARTDGFTRDRRGREDPELAVDHLCFRAVLASRGCKPTDSRDSWTLRTDVLRLANNANAEPLLRGAAQYAAARMANATANFEDALDYLRRARAEMVGRSWYLAMYVDFELGSIAMAQGRVADARNAYASARRAAKADIFEDAGPSVLADVLSTELSLEQNRSVPLARRSHKMHKIPMLANSGAWLDVYVAAAETAIDSVLSEDGPDAALNVLNGIVEVVEATGLETLLRCLVALRVALLVAAERGSEAERCWATAGFPRNPGEIVDLGTQTWREMEAIACAGVRLLTAEARFDDARRLVAALLATSREYSLRRTEVRGLALAIVLEHRAGDPAAARRHVIDCLRAYAETGYARSLVAERDVLLDLLKSPEFDQVGGALAKRADSLARALDNEPRKRSGEAAVFTPRELEILHRLEKSRDKEIANALGLSEDGVRYHNKKIFAKLRVRSRSEATRRARSMGILPATD